MLLRRLVPELGYVAVAQYAWRHRGTVVRALDLARLAPEILQTEGLGGIAERGRVLLELDRTVPRDMTRRPFERGAEAGSAASA